MKESQIKVLLWVAIAFGLIVLVFNVIGRFTIPVPKDTTNTQPTFTAKDATDAQKEFDDHGDISQGCKQYLDVNSHACDKG